MQTMSEFRVKLAAREYARQFYSAVVKSLSKTVTEPITNSDTSSKRKHSLSDASGLVEKALSFLKGTQFDLSEVKKELKGKAPQREIEVHLYTAKGHGREARTCEIVDFAEGLNGEELRAAFEFLAADKSKVSKNRPGRSLFGRGVSDVLLGHKNGTFFSYKDGVLNKLELIFDPEKGDTEPRAQLSIFNKPTAAMIKDIHLRPGENGSCVRFSLHEDCTLYEEGTIVPNLTQFYMLRLINADPNVHVKLVRYRAGKKVLTDTLDYDFPVGTVLDKFAFSISEPVSGTKLPPVEVEGIVCRADTKSDLPGREARDQRANGLLFVDDKDAVLDLTFLPQYEGAPYLAKLFGMVRLKNVREVFSWYLNQGKDSPLTTTRDGFEDKHDFTKMLFKELTKFLVPIYRREEERFNKKATSELSQDAQKRIDDALRDLNKFLSELMGDAEGETPIPESNALKDIQFIPEKTKLIMGRTKRVHLAVKKDLVKPGGSVIYDSSNSKIEIVPLSSQIKEGRQKQEHLIFDLALKSDELHESAIVTALIDGKDETLEVSLEVIDVTSGANLVPPDEMEFRPKESQGQPTRTNSMALYINAEKIPVGRKIKLSLEKPHGTIGFFVEEKIIEETSVIFDKAHLVPGTKIGRIPIAWRGTGWGQSARVIAETKKPDGETSHAEGRILVEQPTDQAGFIKGVKYTELRSDKCSDLVDGVIYINSRHFLNSVVFGTEQQFPERFDNDKTAQYRFSTLVVEQSVFRLAEHNHVNNKLTISSSAPVTSLREFVDQKTNEFAPQICKKLIVKN